MKRSAGLIAALLVLTALSAGVNAYLGYDSSLAVFITWPDEAYDVGSEVTVTVHVFDAGEYYDPDYVNLTVGETMRNITLTRVSTGLYEATFTIEEDDVSEWGQEVVFMAVAGDEGIIWPEEVYHYGVISVREGAEGQFWLSLELGPESTDVVVPGDTVDVTVYTYWAEDLVDPDTGTLSVVYYDEEYDDYPVPMTRVGVGEFEGTFTVPSGLTESTTFEFEANAEYTRDSETYDESVWDYLRVAFFDIWVHYVDITTSSATVDLWVLEMDHDPIEGAFVNYFYEYDDDEWNTLSENLTGTTDEDGKVSFSLDYPDLGEFEYWIWFEVTVESEGLTDRQDGELQVREWAEEWPEEGFYVKMENTMPLAPDTSVTLDFQAMYDGTPYPLKDVTVYILDFETIYEHGSYTTDGSGRFEVTIQTPATTVDEPWMSLDAYFQIEMMGQWEEANQWIEVSDLSGDFDLRNYLDPGTTISLGELRLGEDVEVTLECDIADGTGEFSAVMWLVGSFDDWFESMMGQPEWGRLGYWEFDRECTWSDGAYHATLWIPYFLPEDVSLTFVGIVAFEEVEEYRAAILEDQTPLPLNQPPQVFMTTAVDGEQFNGTVSISGTAVDDESVVSVEYRIDGGSWEAMEGTATWTLELNTTALTSATHSLEVRSFDGYLYSTLVSAVFEVDQPPTAAITVPAEGQVLNGTVTFSGSAADDNSVDGVEWRIDGDTWYSATGTTGWSVELDTLSLAYGDHTLEVRSSDGEQGSDVVQVSFKVDQPPSMALTGHVDGKKYKDKVKLAGTSEDDGGVERVELRIDGGEWVTVDGTTSWTHKVTTKGLKEGQHTLELRAYDGGSYSDVVTTTFKFEKSEEPGFGALAVLLAMVVVVPLVRYRPKGPG